MKLYICHDLDIFLIVSDIVDKYQEQPHLMDPHLGKYNPGFQYCELCSKPVYSPVYIKDILKFHCPYV